DALHGCTPSPRVRKQHRPLRVEVTELPAERSKRSASCSRSSGTRAPAPAYSSAVRSVTRVSSERPGNFYLEVRRDYRAEAVHFPRGVAPAIRAGEEPANEPVREEEKQAKPPAQPPRREGQRTMKQDEAPCREGEGHGDGDGDEHHAHDGTHPEDDQVADGG